MKKIVIFDLDGTLSDTVESLRYSLTLAMEPLGFGPFTGNQCKKFAGEGAAKLVERALTASGDEAGAHFEEAFQNYKKAFGEHCMHEVKPYDGIRDLLAALKEKKVEVAVLSNKPHAETINVIETLFGKGEFAVIQGQMENVALKPSPEGVFQILEKMGLDKEDALYLGDTATDMKTGKGAGLFTVGCLWGFRDYEELETNHADAIIEHPLQLLEYV